MTVAAVLSSIVASVVPAAAGQTREAQLASEQAEKATRLHPYQPTTVERWADRAEAALTGLPQGAYPWFGSVYPGGLFAVGPGVRLTYGRGGVSDAQAAWSLRNYKLARAVLVLPPFFDRRVRAAVHGQVIDAPGVPYRGLGTDSPAADPARYHYRPATFGATLTALPARHLEFGAGVEHLSATTRTAASGTSVDQRFTPSTAPGVGTSPDYGVSRVHAAWDWRDSPGYSRRGGYYRVDWSSYDQRDGSASSFTRLDADVRQLVPILRANWIVALRAAASTTSAEDGNAVPYFLMPQLGGGSDLRGYPSWRFRDRHSVLFSAEYRWTPSHFVDMAIFHDAGKVTADRSDLGFARLRHTNGIGIRFHAPQATILRFEVARGAEGLALILAFGQNF